MPHEIRKVFEGRVFTVVSRNNHAAEGRTDRQEVVRHPGSVVLIPVTDDGQVVLVRQYRPAIGRWAWELPAGSTQAGRRPAEGGRAVSATRRSASSRARLETLGAFFPTPGYCDEEMNFFEATGLREPGAG